MQYEIIKAVCFLAFFAAFVKASFLFVEHTLNKEMKSFNNPNKGLSYKEMQREINGFKERA